jgi:hypothetical protein
MKPVRLSGFDDFSDVVLIVTVNPVWRSAKRIA